MNKSKDVYPTLDSEATEALIMSFQERRAAELSLGTGAFAAMIDNPDLV